VQWVRVDWPAIGYVSIEDVDGYADHLRRLVSDAQPTVAVLASVLWRDARVAAVEHDGTTLSLELVTKNDEVVESARGLYRRWNHARVRLRFTHADVDVPHDRTLDDLALLAGDVRIGRGELDHAGLDAHDHDRWTLRLLVAPTGALLLTFSDVAVEVASVDGDTYERLAHRPEHGWWGPIPDGWVKLATPAVRAAADGDLGGLTLDLDAADPNALDPRWGIAPLHAAAWFDRADMVAPLVGRDAAVDLRDAEDRTPLTLAIDRDSRAAVDALVADGADLEAQDTDGNTPVVRAAYTGRAAIVRSLAAAGARVDARGADQATVLIAAAESNDPATVEVALSLGIDSAAMDDHGRTALARAEAHRDDAAARTLRAAGISR
jgi:hypothetical protein